MKHRGLMQIHATFVEAHRQAHVIQVQYLRALLEQHPFGKASGTSGVHEHRRVGFFGLGRNVRRATRQQFFVGDVVSHIGLADEHDGLEGQFCARLGDVAQEVLGEHGVDERHLAPRISQDVLQFLPRKSQVQRVDHTRAEEPSVVELEILVAVTGHHRVSITPFDVEVTPHRIGQAQHSLCVLGVRGVVGAVVKGHLVWPALHRGEELPVEHELFHTRPYRRYG